MVTIYHVKADCSGYYCHIKSFTTREKANQCATEEIIGQILSDPWLVKDTIEQHGADWEEQFRKGNIDLDEWEDFAYVTSEEIE